MSTNLMTVAEGRYRSLLDASSALADQPTIKAVLRSLRDVLSNVSELHGADLFVLNEDGKCLQLLEGDKEADGPVIKVGTTIPCVGACAEALEKQEPIFLPNVAEEMLKHPELVSFAPQSVDRSTYLFPVSTSQKRYGILALTKDRGQEFHPEDVKLMHSLASHVAVALECALARDRAEQYQYELAGEWDRLRLVLEINNHVARLDMNDVLRSAA